MSSNFYKLKVKEIIRESINAVSVVFELPANLSETFKYEAGQYLTLMTSIKGEEVRRAYSLSSCPETETELKVSVKKIEGGLMSSYLFDDLNTGDVLEVMPPQGSFINKTSSKELVLFAAGSVITPIISILKSALHHGKQKLTLFYGNRSEEETMFKTELSNLQNTSTDLTIQFFESQKGERLDREMTKKLVQHIDTDVNYFICGPEGMIAEVKAGLENSNVDSNRINIEYFASPKKEKNESQTVVSGDVLDIVMVLDDETYEFRLNPNETILEGGERLGIDPPFSCQSGVCTTCKCKVLSGEVEMENNFGLGDDEVEEGYILSCISTPKTPGVKVSWDDV